MNEIVRRGAELGQAAAVVILLHGRGSSGHDIARLADAIPSPRVHWMAPTARSNTWYPRRFLAPLEVNQPWLDHGLGLIDNLVELAEKAGLTSNQIALAGFSQGACLALEYAARNPRIYRFVAALSGALIGPLDTPRRIGNLRGTPVLLACADEDAHIPKEFVDLSEQKLVEANAAVTRLRFPGSAHSIFEEELDWMIAKLEKTEKAAGD